MPTTLPRINVPFELSTYEVLQEISKVEHTSLSQVVAKLVQTALELAEDVYLAQLADKRLGTFRRDDALSSEDLLRWNKSRRKRK